MAQTTRLASFGPVLVISVLPVAYFMYYSLMYCTTLVSVKKKRRKVKKYSPRAQTTRLASFGPVFTISAHPVAYFVIKSYRYSKNLVAIKRKKQRKHKKHSPEAQTMCLASFGPFFIVSAHPVLYFIVRTYIYSKKLL